MRKETIEELLNKIVSEKPSKFWQESDERQAKKISKVIEYCNECEFCEKFVRDHSRAYLCAHTPSETFEPFEPFLIEYQAGNYSKIKIPKNCPLGDYNPK